MGLRERQAAQTRELILDTALNLFVQQGYDATRMEEIAEQAEIGASTLYRYFPTKEQLVVEPLALRGQMATELRSRPPEEPLEFALGHALREFLTTLSPELARISQLRIVLQSTPGVQARLLEEFEKERLMLADAIAERTGRPADDLFCLMTARITTSVLEIIGGRDRQTTINGTAVHEPGDRLRQILDQLRREPPVVPRIDP